MLMQAARELQGQATQQAPEQIDKDCGNSGVKTLKSALVC